MSSKDSNSSAGQAALVTSIALFGGSVVAWTVHRWKQRSGHKGYYENGGYYGYNNNDEKNTNQRQLFRRVPRHTKFSIHYTDRKSGSVGSRGHAALAPPIPYLKGFLKCLQDSCDADTNPRGYVALCVAENKLILDLLAERFMQVGTCTAAFSDSSVYCYNTFLGMPMAREAVAYFLARRFLFPGRDVTPALALQHISPSRVALGAGCSALLNHLFFLLGEDGDCCLIPAPYYAAFENDMNLIAGIQPVPVQQAHPSRGPTPQEMEAACKFAEAQGLHPKFLLLTNPNNPLGTIYRPDVIQAAIDWARQRDMHTIVDEIYALATHQKYDHEFQSVIQILENELDDDVHFLWAVSKDLGASGLRCGCLYTQNEILLEGMATISIFTGVSGPIQYLVSELLTDDPFLDRFLDESRERIVTSYNICTSKLNEMVLPFIPAEAGLFVYVDFSSLLPEKTFEWEEKLSDLMLKYARIVLTPGESQRESAPGMFRICYCWVTPEVLEIAMERLSCLVAKIRRLDWSDLNERSLAGIV